MNYDNLFAKAGKTMIRAGLVGTGIYGISLMAQARFIPRLEIPVVCDQEPKTARRACFVGRKPWIGSRLLWKGASL